MATTTNNSISVNALLDLFIFMNFPLITSELFGTHNIPSLFRRLTPLLAAVRHFRLLICVFVLAVVRWGSAHTLVEQCAHAAWFKPYLRRDMLDSQISFG